MKMSLLSVAFVAVVSSLVTVGASELLRGSDDGAPARGAGLEPGATHARITEPAVDENSTPFPVEVDRLAELERRIAALEVDAETGRRPVELSGESAPTIAELQSLVLGWVKEERVARAQAEERQASEERRSELELGARYQAHLLAVEHTLTKGEEEAVWQLLLEIELRREEIKESLDSLPDDPEEFERRWMEFDSWADQRYVDALGQALVDQLFPED